MKAAMKKTLNADNPFFTFMGGMGDVVLVNILFLVCSLPVFTMGASTVAMYKTFRQLQEGRGGSVLRMFLTAFGHAFRESLIPWLAQLFTGVLLVFDLSYVMEAGGMFWHGMEMALAGLLVLWLLASCHFLPQAAYEGRTLKAAVKASLYLAVVNFPRTLLMGLLNLIPAVCILLGEYFIGIMTPIYVVIGFGLTAYLNTLLLKQCRGLPGEQGEGQAKSPKLRQESEQENEVA